MMNAGEGVLPRPSRVDLDLSQVRMRPSERSVDESKGASYEKLMKTSGQNIMIRLEELSEPVMGGGRKNIEKKIAISNLAHKALTLLEGKNGTIDEFEQKELETIAGAVVRLGDRYLPKKADEKERAVDAVKNKSLGRAMGGEQANQKRASSLSSKDL
jgi:hypothetical protein